LEKISRFRGVRFDSKETADVNKGDGRYIGVIAQELEKEYPELVFGDKKTGLKAVAYDKLTAVLIEAVKEMKALNEKQQAEIEELRSMIDVDKLHDGFVKQPMNTTNCRPNYPLVFMQNI
jgi:hypothetical protein